MASEWRRQNEHRPARRTWRETRHEMVHNLTGLCDYLNANMQCRMLTSILTVFGERFFILCFLIDSLQLIYYLNFERTSYSKGSFVELSKVCPRAKLVATDIMR